MKRSELKAIVKECIAEIFAETFSSSPAQHLKQVLPQQQKQTIETAHRTPNKIEKTRQLKQSLKEDFSLFFGTEDTLKQQEIAEANGVPADAMAAAAAKLDPTEFPGSDKWAKMAFGKNSDGH